MTRTAAHVALILAAMFWGFGNIAQKTVLEHIGPLSATCLRCAIAALVLAPFVLVEGRRRREPGWWTSTVVVASIFATAILLQQTAYLSTSVTNASFLVNTATVLTPVIAWYFLREVTGRLGLVAAVMTLAGVFLMSNGAAGASGLNRGDAICLVSALFYAFWMVALGRHARQFGLPFATALWQFLFAAAMTLPPALMFESVSGQTITEAWPDLAILGLFPTAAAFGLQTVAQRYTSASKAAVLVSGESIFGAIGAYAVLGERPQAAALAGAALIFLAILMVAMSSGSTVASGQDTRP